MVTPGEDFLASAAKAAKRSAAQQEAALRAHLRRIETDPDRSRAERERMRVASACLRGGRLRLAAEILEPLMDPRIKQAAAAELMGDVQIAAGNAAKAEAALVLSLQADLRQPRVLGKLAQVFSRTGRYENARALLHEAIAQREDYAEAYFVLSHIHGSRGEHGLCLDALAIAMRLAPTDARIGSAWVVRNAYLDHSGDRELLEAGREWERRYVAGLKPLPSFKNEPLTGRRLRIAYVSPDFRRHSTAYFFLPLLKNHDRSGVEVFCYHDSPAHDDITDTILQSADHWRRIHGRTDEAVAAQIRRDRIDIVVDLAGHFSNPRLTMHALRPAPVQVHHVGFCGTTGMSAFSARLTDDIIEPAGQGCERLSAEPLVRVAGGLHAFDSFDELPAVQPTPALKKGFVTFGSCNAQSKLGQGVIDAWARILRDVSGSRLLVKNPELSDKDLREHMRQQFVSRGVEGDRVEFAGKSASRAEHLATYHRMDVHLDTFPYNGVTTTCEALSMGVPVLVLAGHCHRGRVGQSLLRNADETVAIATSIDDYVRLACEWSRDAERLQWDRERRRVRIAASRLKNGTAHARAVEDVFKKLIKFKF